MKKFVFLSILATTVLLFAVTATAQDWTSFKEASRNIRSVKADFLQKRFLQILTKPLLSEGKLFFYVPDSVRWEYLNPLRSVMLQKGSTIQVYNFSDGKVFKHTYSPGPPARIILVPREGVNRFIQRIEIVLSMRPGVIDRVEIEEPGDSRTSIEFRNVEINSRISPEVFEKP
jgi:outer membrane lipoprotein-sorting protein